MEDSWTKAKHPVGKVAAGNPESHAALLNAALMPSAVAATAPSAFSMSSVKTPFYPLSPSGNAP